MNATFIEQERRKGRGAITNDVGRFEPYQRAEVDDGWDPVDRAQFKTHVSEERPRSVITRNRSPDLPFDRSINPYRGCEHGCVYCYARPTHAYLGYSAGLDFETRLIARPDAAVVLARELERKGYEVAPIGIGTNTDPYQPIEGRYRIMRQTLEVLDAYGHPLTIVTKGSLVERDIDILAGMATRNLVQVGISIPTLDPHVARKMEPRVPTPKRRLEMIRKLSDAGVPVRVLVAPVVPGLTDHELEQVLEAAKDAGAQGATYILLRLPGEVSEIFEDWLEAHFRDRATRVMNKMRDMRGGETYQSAFGTRMAGEGAYADLLRARFRLARHKLGLRRELTPLNCGDFCVPEKPSAQLSLF